MLLELMIAIVVLAIGMGGVLTLLVSAMYTNTRSGDDTSSTMVAEHVLEQIAAQQANQTAALTITDCAGNAWSISTAGAASGAGNSGSYGGNGAQMTPGGNVDWTQDYAAVPVGYAVQYVACGPGDTRITYDVRWNIVTLSGTSRMILASARPSGSPTVGGLRYIIPVNLRTIGGMP